MKIIFYLILVIVILFIKKPVETNDVKVETEVITEVETETETEIETTEIETEKETTITETEESKKVKETGAYGWTTNDYEEFHVALKMIADNYLVNYKLPHYTKWQFNKFDNRRIFAMTDELTFKGDNKKHTVICVFLLSGEVKENGLHEKVMWSFFGTDEKTYYDDGTCKAVFDVFKNFKNN